MQKIDVILTKYTQLLRSKSVRELKNNLHLLGGSHFNGNKQDYIKKIVMLTQNNETALQKIINMIQGTNTSQVSGNEKQTFFRRQLNKQKLKQIREIEQVKRAGYGKIYQNKRLIDFLKNQVTPAQQVHILYQKLIQLEIEKKQQKLNQKVDILNLLKQNEENQRKGDQGEKRKKPKTLINDYKQKKDEQDPQYLKELKIKNLLHSMNIQTQIILPNYLITQNYENSEEQLKFVLQSQDTNSFNRYIKQKMPPSMKRLRSKTQKTGILRVLSEAISAMRVLKQVSYNKYEILEIFLRDINRTELKSSSKTTNKQKKVINQFIKQERNYRNYYTDYFRTCSVEKNIKIIRRIINFLQIEHKANQQDSTQIILNSIQFCLYFESNILSWLQKQQASQNEQKTQSIIRNLVAQTITIWINYSQKVKINNLQKLANILRLMNQLLFFMDYIDSVVPLGQNQISFTDYYQSIQKQIFQCFTYLFYTEVVTPNLVNQIIINFQKVLGQAQLPVQVLKCIGNIGNRIKSQLTAEAKKSIIKIFGIRPRFEENVNIYELIRQVTEKPIQYGLKQSILAVELVIKYKLSNKQTLIRNIILFNIDPKQLNEKLKQYLSKLVKENTSAEIQAQILQYLQYVI